MIERFISFRYLTTNRGFTSVVTWFSFVGIVLGVATLIIVTSVMNGFKNELLSTIVGMKGHVVITSHNGEYKDICSKIAGIDRITSAIPMVEKQAILMTMGSARGVMVHGISQKDIVKKPLIYSNVVCGSLKNFYDRNVLIGKRMAEILQLKVGDSFSLMLPGGIVTPFGSIPKHDSFVVSGIFEVGMIEYDKNIIIVPLSASQDFFGMIGDKASQIDVFVNDIKITSSVADKIRAICGDKYEVLDWKHSDASIFRAVEVEKNVMTFILSIIILVAVFNIIAGLMMLTNSKTKDIAILRTVGVTRSSILKIFLIVGSFIGIAGTITGASLGLLVSMNIDRIKAFLEKFSNGPLFNDEIYFLSHIPSHTDMFEVCCIIILTIILCLLATIYPARKAAKLDPAEATRI